LHNSYLFRRLQRTLPAGCLLTKTASLLASGELFAPAIRSSLATGGSDTRSQRRKAHDEIAFVAAAAVTVLTTAPPATPSKAEELKMAQVDVQIGRDRYDRYDRDRGRDGATVGIGTGGISVGPRQHWRTVSRDDGRWSRRATSSGSAGHAGAGANIK
jgi:hypothetical protein